jgi:hypothetical protein
VNVFHPWLYGFNVDAKVLKLFDGERQEPTCNIHVTWATDSVMELDGTQPPPPPHTHTLFRLLHWRAKADEASGAHTANPLQYIHTDTVKKYMSIFVSVQSH